MRFAEHICHALAAISLAALMAGCGGGNSSVTTIEGGGLSGTGGSEASVDSPVGPNTTEIVVDAGPAAGFSLGAANIPYVTVTVCEPGSSSRCVTIDHVFVDTGSIGLRLLKSKVSSLSLAPVLLAADAHTSTPAGAAAECYPFVLGALWGTLATADLHVGGETAGSLPVHLIDDAAAPTIAAPSDCVAASNGGLLDSAEALQANGILGIGMLAYDCGLNCANGDYTSGYTLYYSCSASTCSPAAIATESQVQNPIVHFAIDNNGSIISLPSLPDLGVTQARGRLIFGIGTQSNNQIPPTATMLHVDVDPASASYLYLDTSRGSTHYPDSYIDSGTNALFFVDAAFASICSTSAGPSGGWYCPASTGTSTATIADPYGASATASFKVANADALFATSSVAFADLAGSLKDTSSSFVWGLPFFYGRSVFTSIWGQTLSLGGPWNAF